MIFKKIKERSFVNKHIKLSLADVKKHLEEIRMKSDLLAISPTPTKYFWLGINRATHNMFPESSFDIPQYYSRTVYSETELKEIIRYIAELKFEKLVFSGYCGYFESLIEMMRSIRKEIFIVLIYHGSLSELAGNHNMKRDFTKIIDLVKKRKIDRIGFVKKGMEFCINKIFQLDAYALILPPPDISQVIHEKVIRRINTHIGVFANNQLRKNVHNQIAAALMIDNALVHTTDKFEYGYFKCDNRIIDHSSGLPWNDFMFLLSQMDVNLYNTYTETWGQIVVESLALGVPCLTNNSSGVLDTNLKLKEKLVVSEHDNPMAIADLINDVLANRDEIIQMGYEFISDLKLISQKKLNAFLN